MILRVLAKTFDWSMFLVCLFDNSNNGFLHLFLKNMVLPRLVDLIKEFFFTLFIGFGCFLRWHSDICLLFKIYLEKSVVFSSESFDCNCNLFTEVICCCFGERPLDELLFGDHFMWFWLWLVWDLWHDRLSELNRQMDVSLLCFENFFELFLVNPVINTVLWLFDGRCNGLDRNSLLEEFGAGLLKLW